MAPIRFSSCSTGRPTTWQCWPRGGVDISHPYLTWLSLPVVICLSQSCAHPSALDHSSNVHTLAQGCVLQNRRHQTLTVVRQVSLTVDFSHKGRGAFWENSWQMHGKTRCSSPVGFLLPNVFRVFKWSLRFFWRLILWMLCIGRARHPGPCTPYSPSGF